MAKKRRDCADCGEPLSDSRIYFGDRWPGTGYELCSTCRENYDTCSRCRELRHLRDLRGAYCKDCRSEYDRARYARQRAARS